VPGNVITLPDVPLPKLKNMLQLVARPPARAPRPSPGGGGESEHQPHLAAQAGGGGVDTDSQRDMIEEDDYSNLEDSYEVIEKEDLPPPAPRLVAESPQVEVEPFGLATQIKGTPERSARSKKKKPEPRNRGRSQEDGSGATSQMMTSSAVSAAAPATSADMSESFETPPPLPPKRSPHKSMSLDSQQSFEDADMAAAAAAEGSPAPVKGVLTLEAMNGNIQVIKNETHTGMDGIQSRPLPAPPAPIRYGRNTSRESSTTNDHTLMEDSQKFQSARETLTMTNMTTTSHSQTLLATDDDDNTMADSIVDSLVSCTDTLICDDNEDDMDDDDPYPSVNFESGMTEVKDTKTQGKRLEEGTQQLSQELMNHVESLRSTLDNMSNRLGARSRSRSSSRPRSISRTRQNLMQDKL